MKNTLLALACMAALGFSSCSKDKSNNNVTVDEGQVITDFVNVVANPNYVDIQAKATILQTKVNALIAAPNTANLMAAQQAWKDTRKPWESCEGYLFGPVEDNYYDPTMDSWPLNQADVDGLLNSSNPVGVSDVDKLDGTAKGFHAIEYIIFGPGGVKKAGQITDREKLFLASITQSLVNNTTELRDSWAASGGNYMAQVLNAGKSTSSFKKRKDLFKAMVDAMQGICDEVGTGKMDEPFSKRDSTLDESSYSHNTTIDFTNNIQGVLNVYTCTYNGNSGTASLSALVASKNAALDVKIKNQANAAIASLSLIKPTFEEAIYKADQRDQIKKTQDLLATLQTTINIELNAFIEANIKD